MTGPEILDLIRAGKVRVEWVTLVSVHNGHRLQLSVFKDSLRFDAVPAMTWRREPVPATHPDHGKRYSGVRLPSTAYELQQIADLTGCMLLTPKIVDLLWVEAGRNGTQLESVVNVEGRIVAETDIHKLHERLETEIRKLGPNMGGPVEAVGKYWVLSNAMLHGQYTAAGTQAVNYGWPTKGQGNGFAVFRTGHVWQTVGARHAHNHGDPSQGMRLMSRSASLLRSGSTIWETVDLADIAVDPELCGLISHEGVLKVTRQMGVPEPQAVRQADGTYVMPEIVILG